MRIFVWVAVAVGVYGSFASGADIVGNGGGLAEKNVAYAYSFLEEYIDLCLEPTGCDLSDSERDLLRRIRGSLSAERATPDQIKFSSEAEMPGFFLRDGQVGLAKTGNGVGSPIYVNRDLLYVKADDGRMKHFDVGLAASMLVHEFGHHHREQDHFRLDILGSKVQSALTRSSQQPTSLRASSPLSVSRLGAFLGINAADRASMTVNFGYNLLSFNRIFVGVGLQGDDAVVKAGTEFMFPWDLTPVIGIAVFSSLPGDITLQGTVGAHWNISRGFFVGGGFSVDRNKYSHAGLYMNVGMYL